MTKEDRLSQPDPKGRAAPPFETNCQALCWGYVKRVLIEIPRARHLCLPENRSWRKQAEKQACLRQNRATSKRSLRPARPTKKQRVLGRFNAPLQDKQINVGQTVQSVPARPGGKGCPSVGSLFSGFVMGKREASPWQAPRSDRSEVTSGHYEPLSLMGVAQPGCNLLIRDIS